MSKLRSVKWWLKSIGIFVAVVLLLVVIGINIAYQKQDALIQKAIVQLNEGFTGQFSIRESHLSPFANFPYISIDLQGVEVFETKADSAEAVLSIDDVYIGFDIWSIGRCSYQRGYDCSKRFRRWLTYGYDIHGTGN